MVQVIESLDEEEVYRVVLVQQFKNSSRCISLALALSLELRVELVD